MVSSDALLLHLTAFAPKPIAASAEAWQALTQLAPMHQLAPLVAYNLEYRLAGSGAPQVVRDVLLSHYQGALADNVFKFVNLKKALAECPDRQVLLLDAAAFADALYPHIAFRPTAELRLLVHPDDLTEVQRGFAEAGYAPSRERDGLGGDAVSTDDRTRIVLHTKLFGAADDGLWSRALPSRAFGQNAHRPSLEDALLCAVLLQARAGFDTPLIHTLDLRELVRGAPDLGGPYSHPPDGQLVLARAKVLRLERALWTAMELVAQVFPEVAAQARALQPPIRAASQALLRRVLVGPLLDLERTRAPRGLERIRKLLSGA